MKQKISALMDGELFDEDAEAVLSKLKHNPEAHAEWQVFHLISDALRQPDHIRPDISAAMRQRLQDEPIVFAPVTQKKAMWYAVSAAASVMAITLVGWLSVQSGPEMPAQVATVPNAVRPASLSVAHDRDDYLSAHQELSPSTHSLGTPSSVSSEAGQE